MSLTFAVHQLAFGRHTSDEQNLLCRDLHRLQANPIKSETTSRRLEASQFCDVFKWTQRARDAQLQQLDLLRLDIELLDDVGETKSHCDVSKSNGNGDVERSFVLVVATKHEYLIAVEQAGGGLGARLVQFKFCLTPSRRSDSSLPRHRELYHLSFRQS